jgi:eukaryotic-like serine/threonine-protein kinase
MQVGKYQLVGKLAVGGMAEVFLAKVAGPMGFEKTLVVKRILPHLAEDPSFVQMFLGEATLVARLTHPNIVQILDFGESDGTYYLAMEYIDGPSLRTLLDDSLRLGEPLPPTLCARIISAACEGLSFAHDFKDPATGQPLNIVHRDISPDNILLSRQGAVKVADFGIAKAAGQRHRTQTGMIKGKVAYMPPEQIRNQHLDRQADVYALGIVFYELLTGQRPFNADNDISLMHAVVFEEPQPAAQLNPALPEPVLRIIDRAIAKEREQRYPDCLAFQAALEEYLLSTGKPVMTGHLAQHIAQISPPSQQPLSLPVPLKTGPLTDTALRPAAPEVRAPPRVELSPSLIAEKNALEAPPVPVPAPRRGRMLPAAIAGAVLLASGGGYLVSRNADAPRPTTAAPTPPIPPAEPQPAQPETNPVTPLPSPGAETPPPANTATAEASGNPDAKIGTLEIEVRPWAIVYLQGKKLARVAPSATVDINPGTYSLKFVNKKLRKSLERQVEVKAGKTTFVLVDLVSDEEEAPKP